MVGRVLSEASLRSKARLASKKIHCHKAGERTKPTQFGRGFAARF
jgi:hypothetical protein